MDVTPALPLPAAAADQSDPVVADEVDRRDPARARRPDGRVDRLRVTQVLDARRRIMSTGTEQTTARPVWGAYGYFAASVAFYCLYQVATRGRLYLDGSMWAEMGTNYYPTSVGRVWWQQLLTTDAGYIPFPQRVLALGTAELGLPVESVPYVYTGLAMVLTGLMVGCVCLPTFRSVINSDGLRFVLAISIMLVPDFETRTFINFTYFAVVVGALLTARAAVDRSQDLPAWAWVLPAVVLSKPGVLAVVPAMVVVAAISLPRFRRITIVVVGVAFVQAARLSTSSAAGGSLLQQSDAAPWEKALTALKYTFGFIGRLLVGPGSSAPPLVWMVTGLIAAAIGLAAAVAARASAGVLVPIGLSLVFFTMVINAFSFSAEFTRDVSLLALNQYERRFIVPIIGVFLAVAGIVALLVHALADRLPPSAGITADRRGRVSSVVAVAAFAGWFALSGWLPYVAVINAPRVAPNAQASQWVEQAPRLAGPDPTVCIPLDPFGWVYGRNCSLLPVAPGPIVDWVPVPGNGDDALRLGVPDALADATIASLGLLVRPDDGVQRVTARALLISRDGSEIELLADADLTASGGLLQFSTGDDPLPTDVSTVEVIFDVPVTVASSGVGDVAQAAVLWMGTIG